MPKLTVDGLEIEVPPGSTVLQACEAAGREIPIFCFHQRLNIAGNCRMCLVEMERSPKPIASCAMPAGDGMVIKTDTPLVHKARKNVLEMLLINHPLDCPICDQGGECDLQDLTLFYGPDHSRFKENKRSVTDKYLGPLISTHMNRCIHCTRCIRFLDEVAGVQELGMVHRGEHEEISTWIERALHSELQGNIIDLCPVGALNSKPYEYRARPWELRKTELVDVLDAVGCNIRVDARPPEVMRIVPRLHEDINEEWISDKSRFAYDGLKKRRLDVPMVKQDGKLREASWRDAFGAIRARLEGQGGERIAAIVGDLVDCEAMVVLKELMAGLGSPHLDCRQDGAKLDPQARCGYLFNTTIAGIERADLCLLIGTNPRFEAALVNARLRKRWRQGGFTVARVGPVADLTYPVLELGAGPQSLAELADGSHEFGAAPGAGGAADADPGPGCPPPPRRRGGPEGGARARRALRHGQGRLERLQRPAHRGRAGRRPRARPGPGPARPGRARHAAGGRQGRDRGPVPARGRRGRPVGDRRCLRHLPGPPRRPRGAARATSSCRVLPTPRRTRPTSTPRAGRSARGSPCSRRARPRRTGGSCARCRRRSGGPCRSTAWARCARGWSRSRRSWPCRT